MSPTKGGRKPRLPPPFWAGIKLPKVNAEKSLKLPLLLY